jgi:hypothetical protein
LRRPLTLPGSLEDLIARLPDRIHEIPLRAFLKRRILKAIGVGAEEKKGKPKGKGNENESPNDAKK